MERAIVAGSARLQTKDLFLASLATAGLVFGIGILVIAVLLGLTSPSNGLRDAFVFLAFFTTVGLSVAVCLSLVVVAPLGTAFGKLMLRVTPAGWWQGPATGLLVAIVLVAVTLALFRWSGEPLDLGTYAIAAIPAVLAPFAGAFVQRRILHWPRASI